MEFCTKRWKSFLVSSMRFLSEECREELCTLLLQNQRRNLTVTHASPRHQGHLAQGPVAVAGRRNLSSALSRKQEQATFG